MKDKTKLLLFLSFIILTLVTSGVIRMKTADSFKEFMQGVPFVLVPILLIVLYIWIRIRIDDYKLEQHRARRAHQLKEEEKRQEWREKVTRDKRKPKKGKEELLNLKKRLAAKKEKTTEAVRKQAEENKLSQAETEGKDVCWHCKTINPPRCKDCKRCIGKCTPYKFIHTRQCYDCEYEDCSDDD